MLVSSYASGGASSGSCAQERVEVPSETLREQ